MREKETRKMSSAELWRGTFADMWQDVRSANTIRDVIRTAVSWAVIITLMFVVWVLALPLKLIDRYRGDPYA